MFLVKSSIRNIARSKRRNLLILCICMLAVAVLDVYTASLESSRKQLDALPEVIPVTGCITNISGSRTVGLEIKKETVSKLKECGYIKNQTFSMQLAGAAGSFPREEWKKYADIPVTAVNGIKALSGAEAGDITLMPGISLTFLGGMEPYCLMAEDFLEERGFHVGETVSMTLFYYTRSVYGQVEWDFLAEEPFRIVGTIDSQALDAFGESGYFEMVVPFGWAEKICTDKELSWVADSASFVLKNPEELNAFKEEMRDVPLIEVISTAEENLSGSSLVMRDGTYIDSAEKLRENIGLLRRFGPMLMLVVLLTGFVISWLTVQSRKREYALMRAVGMSSAACMAQFFIENAMMAMGGGLLAALIAWVLHTETGSIFAETLGIFVSCYLAGTAIALGLNARVPVMKALADTAKD
ncbi:MAG: hypothetical protein Q4C77_19790 [Eubacteriales bacterium]|nr:hypothetical protein [Eubacteriales bacterium]